MTRILSFLYGVGCYVFFFAVFLWLIAFVGDFVLGDVVTKTVSHGAPAGGLGAALVDIALLALFGLQHSIMARSAFKNWWTRIVPTHIERSTYVLASSLALALLMWQWQPVEGVVWRVENPLATCVLYGLFVFGWVFILIATFLTDHFDLFGLRQVYLNLARKTYTQVPFKTVFLYKFVRHPMMLGILIAFWATPEMTMGHLVFSAGFTIYVFIGIHFEERGLMRALGLDYAAWRARTPMVIPLNLRKLSGK
jgi:methanethiol S-methyltransferase